MDFSQFADKIEIFFYDRFFPLGFIFSFLLGSCIGSFLNVVIWRLPRGESLNHPPSHCPKCDTAIKGYDNIPIIAWLNLKGQCRQCKAPISARYISIEAFCGLGFSLVTYFSWQKDFSLLGMLSHWSFFSILVCLSMIDFDQRIILRRLIAFGLLVGTGLSLFSGNQNFLGSPQQALYKFRSLAQLINNDAILDTAYSLILALSAFLLFKAMSTLIANLSGFNQLNIDKDLIEISPTEIHSEKESCSIAEMREANDWLILRGLNESENEKIELRIDKEKITKNNEVLDAKFEKFKMNLTQIVLPGLGLGNGDAYVAALCAFYCGGVGFIIAMLISVSLALLSLAVQKIIFKKKHNEVPLVPYMSIGSLIWIFGRSEFQEILSLKLL